LLDARFQIFEQPARALQDNRDLRDQHHVHVGGRERRMASDEAGVPPHQLHHSDAVPGSGGFHVRAADHVHRSGEGRLEAEGAIDEVDVVVDRLGDADHADRQAPLVNLRHQAHRAAERAVSPDHEQHTDVELLQAIDHLARILVAARRAEHGAARLMRVRDHRGREPHGADAVATHQPLVAVTEAVDLRDAVTVRELHDQAAHHVVETGAQPAAGDDAALQARRLEEDLMARARQLERRCLG
jgi:hypothetical protein